MTCFRKSLMAAALFAGVAGIGLTPALAQTATVPANATVAASHHPRPARMMPGQLVNGRIAFLKTELNITPAQESQWQQFATVMQQNARSLDQTIATARQHRATATNAVDRMEMQAQFAKVRAENEARLVTAFRPLYTTLSPQQQQVANELMIHGGGWHHGWHHRA
ncbi:MAG TPA: Spy/CpxP family protein refolding chaperone [Stellaceae bacterium]|nr:Spy/CpxP family protein refolding chaperone [Stellaceae bacterium]